MQILEQKSKPLGQEWLFGPILMKWNIFMDFTEKSGWPVCWADSLWCRCIFFFPKKLLICTSQLLLFVVVLLFLFKFFFKRRNTLLLSNTDYSTKDFCPIWFLFLENSYSRRFHNVCRNSWCTLQMKGKVYQFWNWKMFNKRYQELWKKT